MTRITSSDRLLGEMLWGGYLGRPSDNLDEQYIMPGAKKQRGDNESESDNYLLNVRLDDARDMHAWWFFGACPLCFSC